MNSGDIKAVLKQFTRHESGAVVQFIKYGICGVAAVAVHFLFFYSLATMVFPAIGTDDDLAPLLRKLGLTVAEIDNHVRSTNYVINTTISFVFSNLTAYLLNILWVFTSGRHSRVVEVTIFYAVSGTSMLIGTGLAWLLIHFLDFTTTTAFIANLVTSTLINYVMRKFVVFKG